MRSLSLTSTVFFFFFLFSSPSLSFGFDVNDSAKIKCGDLDYLFWELMHKYDWCELKKLPKRPQCGEGRKKCGVPGSHCDDGVCSTSCGNGKPECPDGFRCEKGDCEEREEHESSTTSRPEPKNSTSSEDDRKEDARSPKFGKEKTNCTGNTACADETSKEEECQTRPAGDDSCDDAPERRRNQTSTLSGKEAQKPDNGGYSLIAKGTNKQSNGTIKASLKRSSSEMKPQPAINQLRRSTISSGTRSRTQNYGRCNLLLRQDTVCKSAFETCIRRPIDECKPSSPGCVKLADASGICVGCVLPLHQSMMMTLLANHQQNLQRLPRSKLLSRFTMHRRPTR